MTWIGKIKGALGIKAISDMNLEEVKAELRKLKNNVKDADDKERQGQLQDRQLVLTSLHTGFQIQKVW